MGLRYGDVAEVVATPRVEILIHGGHLQWCDEDGNPVVEVAEPVMSDASFDDEPKSTISLAEPKDMVEANDPPAPKRKLRSVKTADDAE